MSGSESVKNTIGHHVFALSKLFGLDSTTDTHMLDYANKLEQSIGTFGATQINHQSLLDVICEGNPQADALIQKFNDLKLRNARELVPCVYMYSRLKRDSHLLSVLDQMCDTKRVDRFDRDNVKSPDLAFARQSVNQLQQRIADSSTLLGSTLRSVGSERIARSVLTGTLDDFSVSDAPLDPYSSSDHGVPIPRTADPGDAAASTTVRRNPPLADSALRHPVQPKWLFERCSLWNDFLPPMDSGSETCPKLPIESLPSEAQEHAVVGDLLRLLQANQGLYIKPVLANSPSGIRSFQLDENMAPTLMDVANKILPICADYSTTARFIDVQSLYSHGLVNHALAGAMKRLVKDYFILLCQLENQYRNCRLGVARLQFALQDTSVVFSQLARIATDIQTSGCMGGAVLSLLFDSARKVYGVKQLHDLTTYLLRSACVPFFGILQKWIYRGVITDPYHEFFIAASPMPEFLHSGPRLAGTEGMSEEDIDWANFWERHHTIVSHNLPSFLESHMGKILNSGKYLNVVQQCADCYELPPLETLEYDDTDFKYLEQIERAYSYSSSLLLKLMIKDKELKEHLNSIKRYFLLDQADFIVHFMDAAAQELCKPSSEVSLPRLSSLLELAIRTSTASVDPYKDNLKVVIYKYDLITQILMVLRMGTASEDDSPLPEDVNLTGLEAFSVDYSVRWPISLVLNRQVMDRYQMLFRHMFYCKHVERLLCNSWVLGKLARKADCLEATWFSSAFLLGQRMLTFIQHLQYYMAVEVIEPTWHQFFQQMDKVSNLDALLDAHLYCLEVCMDDCLLASPELLSLFGKLAVVCVLFANFVQRVLAASIGGGMDAETIVDSMGMLSTRGTFNHDHLPVSGSVDFCGRTGSHLSIAASTMSSDTVLTKVTREDFNQFGSSEIFTRSVVDFDRKFNSLFVEFIEKLKCSSRERNKLSSLVSRLDFNDFYSTGSPSHRREPTGLSSDSALRRPYTMGSSKAEPAATDFFRSGASRWVSQTTVPTSEDGPEGDII